MAKRRKTPAYKLADAEFSKIVRHNATCAICETWENLQCAHGIGRSHRAVRWDKRNAWPLCRDCHVFMTHRPAHWTLWLKEQWGEEHYWEMYHLAKTGKNPDPEEILANLRAEWKALSS